MLIPGEALVFTASIVETEAVCHLSRNRGTNDYITEYLLFVDFVEVGLSRHRRSEKYHISEAV